MGFNAFLKKLVITNETNDAGVTAQNEVKVLPSDFALEIASGNISGVSYVNKFGRAPTGMQTSVTDVWDRADATPTQQVWTAPTQARTHQIVSSDAADDGTPEAAGAGAQAVRIWGLTSWSSAEVSEDVVLNGVANVATVNSYVIIHRMKVIPVGSTYAVNTGVITATADTDGTVTAQINAGKGQTQMAIYGIPSTQTAYFHCYYMSLQDAAAPATAAEVDFSLLVNERPDLNLAAFTTKQTVAVTNTGTSTWKQTYNPYFQVAGPAIIKIQGIGSAADLDVSAGFDLILKTN